MLHLPEIIFRQREAILARLDRLPDAQTVLDRLCAILNHQTPPPWFPATGLEPFVTAMTELEQFMLENMTWEVDPDPVSRARARTQLRTGIAALIQLHAAHLDREQATLKSRLQSTQEQLDRAKSVVSCLLETSGSAALLLDRTGTVLQLTRRAQDLLNLPLARLIGHSITAILSDLDVELVTINDGNRVDRVAGITVLRSEKIMDFKRFRFEMHKLPMPPAINRDSIILNLVEGPDSLEMAQFGSPHT